MEQNKEELQKETKKPAVKKLTDAEKEKLKEKERLAKEKAKAKEKEKLAKEKEKQKEKEKLAREKEKAKEKERLAKEKEKQKEKERLAKEKEKAKQKERLSKEKAKEKEKLAKEKQTKPKTIVKKDDSLSKKIIIEPEKKKSLEDIVKHDNKEVKDKENDKPLDHVEILRKKMEAQKKLNETPIEKKDNDIITKLQKVSVDDDVEVSNDNNEEANLKEQIELLTKQLSEKDEVINKTNAELNDKISELTILTNSIASKTTEAELLKKIDELKAENEKLKNNKVVEVSNEVKEEAVKKEATPIDINSDLVKDIVSKGDILLRIKLLNERIAEKDAQIKIVEDELNSLSEEDIVAIEFKKQINSIRDSRNEFVKNANDELVILSNQIKQTEENLLTKKRSLASKKEEISAFDENIKTQRLSYAEKDEQLSIRSRMYAECDALSVDVSIYDEEFKKLCSRYKKILSFSEEKANEFNELETNLISLYLKKLKDEKVENDENYKESIEERDNLLNELNNLNQIYEQIKDIKQAEINVSTDELQKAFAKVCGKLSKIDTCLEERTCVEEVLRTVDPEVSAYLNAFNEKEIILYNINDKKSKMTNENKQRFELIINDDNEKISYLDGIIQNYENNEKVLFYKNLIKSIEELKDKRKVFASKADELKEQIKALNK